MRPPLNLRPLLGLTAPLLLLCACTGTLGDPLPFTSEAGAGGAGGAGGAPTTSVGPGGAGGAGGEGPTDVTALEMIDLGTVSADVAQSLEIPEGTLGFTVQVGAPAAADIIGILSLRSPAGAPLITSYAMSTQPQPYFANYGWVSCANPQTDDAAAYPVAPGAWTFTASDDTGPVANVAARAWIRRTNDGAFHGGVVDVNVIVAPGAGVDQAYLQQVVSGMFPYVGLDLGQVSFYQADAGFDSIDSYAEYQQMLQSSEGMPSAPALNLFVTSAFTGPDFGGGGVLGVAGGIPGSPQQHGTTQSGVAYAPSGDPAYDAAVMMHEVGHLAGLFHTTEVSIPSTDPLSDTATCDPATIQNNIQSCPDTTNVMFPIAFGATTFSPAQRLVVHGSTLYRGAVRAGGPPAAPLPSPSQRASLPPWSGASAAPLLPSLAAAARPGLAPDPVERVLSGGWCRSAAPYEELVIRLAAAAAPPGASPAARATSAAARLRALTLDLAASPLVRSRALAAYVRAALPLPAHRAPALALAEAFAADAAAHRHLRLAGLRALSAAAPARARALAPAALSSADPAVRAVAGVLLGPISPP